MEKMLPRTHASPQHGFVRQALTKGMFASFIGVFLLIVTPYIHFGVAYSFWNVGKEPVNRKTCTCNCWDSYFKGSYEKRTPGYKHMYFNITHQMLKIWILTIVAAIVTYEVVRHLILLFTHSRLRYSMFILFASVLYSHYYAWWGYINAYNDDFYQQWYHQAIFSITELTSTAAVVHMCNKNNSIKPFLLLVIIAVAVFHILASGADQFVENVLRGKGEWHQFTRDLGFMIPDILHIVVSLFTLRQFARVTGYKVTQVLDLSVVCLASFGVLLLLFICSML